MRYSSVFKPDIAGKYLDLPGFSAGISLGENLTTPLSQQVSGINAPSGSSLDDILGDVLRRSFDPNYQKETLRNKLAYDKEQMKQAFPYLMAREIPRLISDSFARTADITRETGYAVPRAYADTFRALSRGPY
jgi:hypothetical protein